MGNNQSKQSNVDTLSLARDDISENRIDCSQSTKRPAPTGDIHSQVNTVNIYNYDYPFENLVIEGGGNKAIAYVGALKLFESLGITVTSGKIKRLCGTSAGSYTALFLALGYTASEIERFLSVELKRVLLDFTFGYLNVIPNLIRRFGWNAGNKFEGWIGQKIYDKTGNGDFTFMQLYEQYGVEFCAVVVNINQMTVEYCHPKTTPDMPLRLAVKMSCSVPVVYSPSTYDNGGTHDLYVDGGLLCNFPIHAFDGWWLSMKKDDGFFKRLKTFSEITSAMDKSVRFGTFNDKTLGLCLYSNDEEDPFRSHLQNRVGTEFKLSDLPRTKLAKKYKAKAKAAEADARAYQQIIDAIDALLATLDKYDLNGDQKITIDEFEAVMRDDHSLSATDRNILFDSNKKTQEIFYEMSQNDDEIDFKDLCHYLEKRGLNVQSKAMGHRRCQINSLPSFLNGLQMTLMTNASLVYVEQHDVRRTIGINTGHVTTGDLDLQEDDVKFAMERGRKSAMSFLQYYVLWNNLEPIHTK